MTIQQKQTNALAIVSLILGILGMAIPAVICGHIARSQISRDPENQAGEGLALAGLILGYVVIGICVLFFLLVIPARLLLVGKESSFDGPYMVEPAVEITIDDSAEAMEIPEEIQELDAQ